MFKIRQNESIKNSAGLVHFTMVIMLVMIGLKVYQFLSFENLQKYHYLQSKDGVLNLNYHTAYDLPFDLEAVHYYEYRADSTEQEEFFLKVPLKMSERDLDDLEYPKKKFDNTFYKSKIKSDYMIPIEASKLNSIVHFEFYLLISFILIILFLVIKVRRLLKNLDKGLIFIRHNLIIINDLTRWIIFLVIARIGIDTAVSFYVMPMGTAMPFSLRVGLDMTTLLFVLLLVIINHAFKEGISLKEEQSLTI